MKSWLKKRSREPEARNPGDPFLAAALSGDDHRLGELRGSGEDVDSHGELGMTALLSAIFIRNPRAVRLLLESGADPNRFVATMRLRLLSCMHEMTSVCSRLPICS